MLKTEDKKTQVTPGEKIMRWKKGEG